MPYRCVHSTAQHKWQYGTWQYGQCEVMWQFTRLLLLVLLQTQVWAQHLEVVTKHTDAHSAHLPGKAVLDAAHLDARRT